MAGWQMRTQASGPGACGLAGKGRGGRSSSKELLHAPAECGGHRSASPGAVPPTPALCLAPAPPAGERLQFIRLLQEFSISKGLRVSILSGDAHVGGVGRLYSRPKIKNIG